MASSKSFLLEIVTPSRQVFSGQVSAIIAPGEDGYLGVLPGHTPLFTSLQTGYLKVEQNFPGEEPRTFYFAVSGGFAEVLPGGMAIFANNAEPAAEIDVKRAKEAKERASKRLHEGRKQWDLERCHAALTRAENRLKVAERTS